MTMGEYIRELRTERGWSQETLGNKVGVNRAAVQKWEKGSVENIKRSTIKQLADIFQVSPCELMCWSQPPDPDDGAAPAKEIYDTDTLEAIDLFQRLDPIDRGAALERMRILLQNEKYSSQEGLKNA